MRHFGHSPTDAYRRAGIDARIEGTEPARLVLICLEQVHDSLSHALIADRRGEVRVRQDSLAGAHRVLLGLLYTLDRTNSLADALDTVYRVALHRIERAMRDFDSDSLALARLDVEDLLSAFSKA